MKKIGKDNKKKTKKKKKLFLCPKHILSRARSETKRKICPSCTIFVNIYAANAGKNARKTMFSAPLVPVSRTMLSLSLKLSRNE